MDEGSNKYCVAIDVTTGGYNFNYRSEWIDELCNQSNRGFVCERTGNEPGQATLHFNLSKL